MAAHARRDQLLDVTMELIAGAGFASVSMQAVAQRAGVSRPVVYEHFATLQGLLEALVDREMSAALEQVSETALGDLSGADATLVMLESLSRYLAAVHSHPATWRLVLTPPQGAPESLRRRIARGRARVLARIDEAVSLGSLNDTFASDSELSAHLLSAIADEYARLLLDDPERYPRERLLAHASLWLRELYGTAA